MGPSKHRAGGQRSGAVVQIGTQRIRAVLRGAQVTPIIAVDHEVVDRSRTIHHQSSDFARITTGEAADQPGGEVESFTIDWAGWQPERVVFYVREIIAGQRTRPG